MILPAFDINQCFGKSGVEERTENDMRLPTAIKGRLFKSTGTKQECVNGCFDQEIVERCDNLLTSVDKIGMWYWFTC